MNDNLTRRAWLAGAAGGLAMTSATARAEKPVGTFRYCLNTSTVRDAEGKSRPLVDLIDIAAKAGYHAIEPWIGELNDHVKAGGTLKDIRKKCADAGLAVPDAIGFSEWIVEDPDRRKKGLEQAKRDMDLVQQIGGTHLRPTLVCHSASVPSRRAARRPRRARQKKRQADSSRR